MFEHYKKNTIVICPDCHEEGRIIERSNDYSTYTLDCKSCGRKQLSDSEEMKARAQYNKQSKDSANGILYETAFMSKKQ